ncbi:UDP-glycosyltransferase 74C1 [Rhizoctonia solani AG-3 Rhs1AP]|uniref:UDP-glycosyltransferase 74C1 n=2 Tax=Rhizoctonia solani AG-3 TaxID=1086053 RepID=A0A074RSP6_9AGAM|nr:UDP-glycosyltransferase 74C1 [Rhizoctonia solani AG-3 Rhs1AP]KEP48330.1 UDP-glycosyltransferase 74C1 [Rhizoctonia solani 123E]
MTYPPLKHIIFIIGPPWGHLRHGLKTSLRMVEKFPDLFISVFVYHKEVSKALKHLSAQPTVYPSRVRVVTTTNSDGDPLTTSGLDISGVASLEKSFGLWVTSELQQATVVQLDDRPINKPSLIIEDFYVAGAALASKSIHGLPIVAWWSMTAAALTNTLGHGESDKSRGVFENIYTLSEEGQQHPQEDSDSLICMPGVPPRYKWEFAPQDLPFLQLIVPHVVARMKIMAKHVRTVVICSTVEFEPIPAAVFSNAVNTKPFFIGPSVDLAPTHQTEPESPVTQFLDRAYTEKGAHSVIYVSFGTIFFPLPSSTSHLMTVLDEILHAGFKFILTLSSDTAQLDKSSMDGHVRAGNAIFPEWTNQTAVLEHPAIHYFLSHGGWNSSTEAIVRGVPMMFWPIMGDQIPNAVQIAEVHDCGFELLQVRTGPAKSKAYQNGTEVEIVGTDDAVREEIRNILALSKGPRGEHQRMNTRLLGKVIANSLGPNGSGDIELEKFGKALELA